MVELQYVPQRAPLPALETVGARKFITIGTYVGGGSYFGKCACCGSQFMSTHDLVAVIDGEKHCPRCAGYK